MFAFLYKVGGDGALRERKIGKEKKEKEEKK